ncbi:hypothetical protein CsatA_024590 [Cannabis sativa]
MYMVGNDEIYYNKLVTNDYEPPGPNRPMPPYGEYNYYSGQRTRLPHHTTFPSRNDETYYKLVINDYEPPGPNRPMPPYEEYNYNSGQRTSLPSSRNYEEPHPKLSNDGSHA